jgi:hypothetical protein
MGGLGLRTFDAASFENTLERLISHQPERITDDIHPRRSTFPSHYRTQCVCTLMRSRHASASLRPSSFVGLENDFHVALVTHVVARIIRLREKVR